MEIRELADFVVCCKLTDGRKGYVTLFRQPDQEGMEWGLVTEADGGYPSNYEEAERTIEELKKKFSGIESYDILPRTKTNVTLTKV